MKKSEKIQISVNQYWIAQARDYHEFPIMKQNYKDAGINVKYYELGCTGRYYALFWIGKKPEKVLRELKKEFDEYE